MRIWKIEGDDLHLLNDRDRGLRYMRIAVDGDTIKVKFNEGEWTLPLGTLEVDEPEVDTCTYCSQKPKDAGYDRCYDCRTWRDEEWCEAHRVEHSSDRARELAWLLADHAGISDYDKRVARVMVENADQPGFDRYSAMAAIASQDDEVPADQVLYEKCQHCHLFVEPNDPDDVAQGCAAYVHSHRGDAVDTVLDESHEAAPSGRKANLLTWKTYGPLAMRERFVD